MRIQAWEYDTLTVDASDYKETAAMLDRQGEDGWELVQAIPAPTYDEDGGRECLLIFKRPKA